MQKKQSITTGLDPTKTFQSYVPSSLDASEFTACICCAALLGSYASPLVLVGPEGCGKSHLLNASGNLIRANHPVVRIHLFSGADISGLQAQLNNDDCFSKDVLIVDDIQGLIGQPHAQQILSKVADNSLANGKQLIFAGTMTSEEITNFIPEFQEVLLSGYILSMLTPCLPHRAEIIQKKAKEQGVKIDHGAAYLLAHTGSENIRELERHLSPAINIAKREGTAVSIQTVKDALCIGQASALHVESAVCSFNHVRPQLLQSRSRVFRHQQIRGSAMYLMSKGLNMNNTEIATRFPAYTRTEVHALIQDIAHQRSIDPEFHHDMYLMESMTGFTDAHQSCHTDSK